MNYKECEAILRQIYIKNNTTVEEMAAIGKAIEIMKVFQMFQEGGLINEEDINRRYQEGSQEACKTD